ncbi:hypothetical protein PGT21_026292 [Puccinia graminis f. sp. tritici]|uniref:TNFR-Cys domain-containing protein n=1 Tax=Puccinia graminis f. sp. tritici TaxID=56615 RepID=A0A5B0NB46_PUCGR|nr:hypothetical protein PGT21_026292 [Puccinia graminis f. sp. tritici]
MHCQWTTYLALVPFFLQVSLVQSDDIPCKICPKYCPKGTIPGILEPTKAQCQYTCGVLRGHSGCMKNILCDQYECKRCGWAALKATSACSDSHPIPPIYYYKSGDNQYTYIKRDYESGS